MSVDKLIDSTQLDADLTSVANAIRRKSGKSEQLSFPSEFVSEINDITPVIDTTPIDDVTFVDYDGTVLHTYSADEFAELTDMPSNPSHTGLVAQGWNWTLAGAKEYVAENGCLCIGQNYTTDNGDTRIYITVTEDLLSIPLYLGMYTSVKGGVRIDWGDGIIQTTTANASAYGTYSHTYEEPGDYVVLLKCTDGFYNFGYNGSNNGLFNANNSQASFLASLMPKKIEIGDSCTQMHRQCFTYCRDLKTISIPTTLTKFGSGTSGTVFTSCYNLQCLVFPSESIIYGTSNFSGCTSIKYISYPETATLPATYIETSYLQSLKMMTLPPLTGNNVLAYGDYNLEKFAAPGTYTNLAASFCRECRLVRRIVIPAAVTNIADYAMTNIILKELHMRPTTPPTIANTRGMPNLAVFNGIIYVPYSEDHSTLEAYQTATNWSTYAQYMQEEPQS